MKKLLYVIVSLVVLVGIAAVALPILLDPNKYKAEIAQKFKESTGYNLEIDGDIKVSLFPVPNAYVNKVAITNNNVTLVDVDEISAFLELAPLLSGQIKVGTVQATNPTIKLSKNEIGGNWEVRKKQTDNTAASQNSGGKKFDLKIDKIIVENGNFNYVDRTQDKTYDLQNINIEASLGSSQGPLNIDGSLVFNGDEISLAGSVSNFSNPQLDVKVNGLGIGVAIQGDNRKGGIAIETEDVNKAIEVAGVSSVGKFPNPSASLSGNYEVSEGFDVIKLSDAKVSLGGTSGSGKVEIQRTGLIDVVDASLNFDRLVVADMTPAKATSSAGNAKPESRKYEAKSKIRADVNLSAKEVVLSKGSLNNLKFGVSVDGKNIDITSASVSLPGGGSANVVGVMSKNTQGKRYFDGRVEAKGSDLRKLLAAIDVNLDAVNSEKLKNFAASTDVLYREGDNFNAVDLKNTRAKIDEMNFSGKIDIALKETRPSIAISGSADSINLDTLLKKKPKDTSTVVSPTGVPKGREIDLGWLKKFGIDLRLGVAVGRLTFGGQTYSGLKASGTVNPNELAIQNFYFNSGKFEASGKLSLSSKGSRPYFKANLSVPKLDTGTLNQASTKSSSSSRGSGGDRWSTKPFDVWPMRQIDGEFSANIGTLNHSNISLANVRLNGDVKDAKMQIKELSANGFGGNLTATANVGFSNVPSFNTSFSGVNLDIQKIATQMVGNTGVSGIANLSGNISSSGLHEKSMVQNLKGTMKYAARDVYARGFGLQDFVRQVRNVRSGAGVISLLKLADSSRKYTYIQEMTGNMYGEDGVFSTKDTKMMTDVASGTYQGYIDFPNWNVESNAVFNVVIDENKKHPSVGARIFGPPNNIKIDFDTAELERYIGTKVLEGVFGDSKAGEINNQINSVVEGAGAFNPETGEIDVNKAASAIEGLIGKDKKKQEQQQEQAPAAGEEQIEAAPDQSAPAEQQAEPELQPEPVQEQPREVTPEEIFMDVLGNM